MGSVLDSKPAPKTESIAEKALRLHALYQGKIQVMPKCPVEGGEDFAVWYTPGVAEPCRAIKKVPEEVYRYTNKGNTIAIITDGSRVLGLGDIGPEAGLPVMDGKALLFKDLGGVDAVPICLDTKDPDRVVETVRLLQPSFGGINLEDIAQPKCFGILDSLKKSLDIPVWHDDQQGTATATMAALTNALKVVGKELGEIRFVMVGMGAANVAVFRMLEAMGVEPGAIVAFDEKGLLHKGRHDIEEQQDAFYDLWKVCRSTNPDNLTGEPGKAFRGADVCIAFSEPRPGVIDPTWIKTMNRDAAVFACANPEPEIWPEDAKAAGARIVATGRSDFPNQLNNSLVFPGLFRGVLDCGSKAITNEMILAATKTLADFAEAQGLDDDHILPAMDDWKMAAEIAAAVAVTAQEEGIARTALSRKALYDNAVERIDETRQATRRILKTNSR